MSEGEAAPPPAPRRRWPRYVAIGAAGVLALAAALLGLLDTGIGHRFIADRIGTLRPSNGLRYQVGRIEGSIYSKALLINVRVSDAKGLVFVAPRATLDWRPFAWIGNRLDIRRLTIPRATLARLPQTVSTGRKGPMLPGFDIHVGELRVDRLTVGAAVTGVERRGRLLARADIRSGRALVDLAAEVAGSDVLRLKLDSEPDRDRFDLDLAARGEAGGVLAKLTGVNKPVSARVSGDGRWSAWRGRAQADAGGERIVELALENRAGRYALSGVLSLDAVTRGQIRRLAAPRTLVRGEASFENRQLAGNFALRSSALAVEAEGTVDFAGNAFRKVGLRARLLRPAALVPDMTGQGVTLNLRLDGAFDRALFDYALAADRVAFGKTGFDRVRAVGRGRLSKAPVLVPVRLSAAQVTGVGDVAGGILRGLSVEGVLRISSTTITGNQLRLRSDKLDAQIMLLVDLRTGRYEVSFAGGLNRFLIPGLGVVDVTTDLRVVPGAGGKGASIEGRATAQMVRLDNGFFRSLTGGLPRIETRLRRGPDGIIHFTDLVLTSPELRLAGSGYRRNDGTFHFEGRGTQAKYGPLSLVLDGRIEKPTLDLRFERPNAALGLRDVRAHLDPTPEGFDFTATGGSTLGPFEGAGAILLPSGGTPTIQVARLDVGGAQLRGALDIVTGGFDGRLASTGALEGELLFQPVNAVQRIEAHLTARSARLGPLSVRSGKLDAVVMLDPAGTDIDATVQAQGVRRGTLSLARLAARAQLRDGVGEVRASIAGSRGRGFDIQSVTQVRGDRFSVVAQGRIDRREIRLVTPAVLIRDGDAWRLQPTQVAFAGGEARVSGRIGGGEAAIDASLRAMPLSVLDIGYPGLGLGGSASGTLTFASREGGAPTGRVDMTVRGLTRSGLVLSSKPIDIGVAGTLTADRAAMRAVMASEGKTIGRAQARLAPLGGGSLERRLSTAPMFGQLRYDGPADTLWRLTGIELFDLSGPVAIGADLTGTIDSPRIRGSVRTETARIESAVTGTVLANVQSSGRFDGSRLVIDRFAATDGQQGKVSASGAIDFGAANGVGIDLNLQANEARMINRDDIAATVTGPLTIRSDGAGGTIAGEVTLVTSRYRLGRASASAAVPKLDVREINRPYGADELDDAPSAPWRLDITANAPSRMEVTGLGLTSEWAASFRIRGEPTNPSITGRADLLKGDYEFAGREFDIDRGSIRFDGSTPANPTLDIVANADTQGLNATIRVSGSADRPEISFASIPALPQDELLSRLLFGTSITNLSAPEALQLAAAVAALQSGGNGLDPINAVRRAVGLDRLRVLAPDVQTGQGTAVAAGKYLTRRTYVEIITDGQGYSATRLEFQVTRWLSLLATISTAGRQSANVRISRDY